MKKQHEFVKQLDAIELKSNALDGSIGDEDIARRDSNPELNGGEPAEAMTRAHTSVRKLQRSHNIYGSNYGWAWRGPR